MIEITQCAMCITGSTNMENTKKVIHCIHIAHRISHIELGTIDK